MHAWKRHGKQSRVSLRSNSPIFTTPNVGKKKNKKIHTNCEIAKEESFTVFPRQSSQFILLIFFY